LRWIELVSADYLPKSQQRNYVHETEAMQVLLWNSNTSNKVGPY
jgi:hypothetical protein